MVNDGMSAQDFADVYMEIAETIGVDNTLLLFELLKGRQSSFPQRIFRKEYVENYIKQNYNGKNIRELSRKFGYTERRIKQIIKSSSFE